jgi:hypothetical protein
MFSLSLHWTDSDPVVDGFGGIRMGEEEVGVDFGLD